MADGSKAPSGTGEREENSWEHLTSYSKEVMERVIQYHTPVRQDEERGEHPLLDAWKTPRGAACRLATGPYHMRNP